MADENGEAPFVVREREPPAIPTKPRLDTVRFSMNAIKESAEWQLDALLEELSALETELSGSAGDQMILGIPVVKPSSSAQKVQHHEPPAPAPKPVIPASVQPVRVEVPEQRNRIITPICAPSSCSSPDGDSAYGDGSSTESQRFHGSNVSSADSCRDSLNTPSPTQVSPKDKPALNDTKAQKIREALEKMKEAKIVRIYISFFIEDGAPLKLLVDERWSVRETMRQLAEKHNMVLYEDHCLVEEFPNFRIKRIYEDHEKFVENVQMWLADSPNKLWFVRRSDKYPFVDKPETYLVTERMKEIMDLPEGDNWPRDVKQQFIRNYFERDPVIPPELEGMLFLKDDRKSWKKLNFSLRHSGLYCSIKGKKSAKDLHCLMNLHSYQVYSVFDAKQKFKAPTEWCFCIKLTTLQIKKPTYIKYICCDDEATFRKWIVALRIAKNGAELYQNYISALALRKENDSMTSLSRAESSMSNSTVGISHSLRGSHPDIRYGMSLKAQAHMTPPPVRSPIPSVMQPIPTTSFAAQQAAQYASNSSSSSNTQTPQSTTSTTPDRPASSTFSAIYANDELTGTIKRAPEHLLRRVSQPAPIIPTLTCVDGDEDDDAFPEPPPAVALYSVIQKSQPPSSTEVSDKTANKSVSPIPPPKPSIPPPLTEKPPPPVRTTPSLHLTPLAKKAPPPPPKRAETTRVQTIPAPVNGQHMNELEAALGRRRERIGDL